MNFYLGTHHANWLPRVPVPLFISQRTLARRRTLPRAAARWALDSGAFTEVATHGQYLTTPSQYVRAIRRYRDDIGLLDWAAPQDHMTEPWVLAKSLVANTIGQAQDWTVQNYLELRSLDDTLPIIPVLQGQRIADYERHVGMYALAGIDLLTEPLVGLGSVCRRQATDEIAEIIAQLSIELRLHGFGVKMSGLGAYGWMLASSDSMAWSYDGRRINPCPVKGLTSCNNCVHHALSWRDKVLGKCERRDPVQMALA
ncbi:MAG TPA: hypothetical protein VLI04_13640 [Nocardioidaceae bacterium]|nr:hypothetical protein [Nocardioidaceae bacterium]